jgi:hypothetical protein
MPQVLLEEERDIVEVYVNSGIFGLVPHKRFVGWVCHAVEGYRVRSRGEK